MRDSLKVKSSLMGRALQAERGTGGRQSGSIPQYFSLDIQD